MIVNKGVASVTFRKIKPLQIIQMAKNNGLQSIEWGADVHVKPKDIDNAKWVCNMTKNAGLEVAGYGSYFVAGQQNPEEFKMILQAAVALEAPVIRVWAGWESSQTAEIDYVKRVIECTRTICDMAAERGILVGYEYHPGTLIDDASYAVKILQEIGRDNMRLYWQPDFSLPHSVNCAALKTVLPYLQNIHAFYLDEERKRLPLQMGRKEWMAYVKLLENSMNVRSVLLEFVKDDSEEQLVQDAQVLKEILN